MDDPTMAPQLTNHHLNLNVPPTMSLQSLTPPSHHISRMINSSHQQSPSRTIYSDRFIPSRSTSNFDLFNISQPSPNSPAPVDTHKDDNSGTYTALLRAALFGPDTPDKKDLSGPPLGRNIFRFKSETRRSMHSLSPFGFDDDVASGVSQSPVKAPRKVPRSPYKILDAPALQDDFYLNLVDWSSHNVLAVGLGNCVYLWNACSSKVTKLCDLGMDDSVCSVGWAQRGTHLAVGTSHGKLQVRDECFVNFVAKTLDFRKQNAKNKNLKFEAKALRFS
ncbi:protein FIZZY-RELATED 2-like [Pistacia vera]|uniref:protein FIZZY-RELATED 2-like n=1 Tax=Pistacia vera TaxID=55513 RepID=UPI001263C697|nr:protein FIZZY-RELATED 2-like [Pistacia vera]